MLRNYLKIAWRNTVRNKWSSLINVVGLTLGISVCMVLLIFVRYESSFDTQHPHAEHTYRVVQHNSLPNQTQYWNTTAYPLAEALRNDFPEIEKVTQVAGPMDREFSITDNPKEIKRFAETGVLFVDSFYPKTFDVQWMVGDPNTALLEINSIVLTEKIAQKFFDIKTKEYQTIVGKTILLQGKDPLKVTGVVKDPPGNVDHQYRLLIPYEFFKINNPYFSSNWSGNYQGTTFVVLGKNSTKEVLEAKIEGWKKKYLIPEDDKRISYLLQPLKEMHNETLYGNSPGGYVLPKNLLYTLTLVACFILLIAIVNFVNLLTAQSISRSKEVGMRKVMGGNRLDLVVQFILENGILILGVLGLSVVLVTLWIDLLNAHLPIIALQLQLGWEHIGLLFLIGLGTLILAAIYPAIKVSAFNPIQALRSGKGITGTNRFDLRKTLVTFQFVLVQLFVIAALILAVQMDHFRNTNLGFSSDKVIITKTPEFGKLDLYRERLLANSNIAQVAVGSGPPMAVDGFQLGTRYRLPEQPVGEALNAEMKIADIHYLDFYDLELLAGRNFLGNKENFDEFIVNETLLKSFGWAPSQAIGKKIQINEGQATIVGVVKDFHNNSLQYGISPCIFLNWRYYQNNAFVKITGPGKGALGTIEAIWKDTFTSSVYAYGFLEDSIAREYLIENMVFMGFWFLSILAISIGCLGLFGLMSFVISKKTKEVGIRKVLGATLSETLFFFAKEFMGLILLAFIIAVPFVYYFMDKWLEGFTHRIDLSAWMFLSGGLATLIIAVLACSYQSLKASSVSPIHALREE